MMIDLSQLITAADKQARTCAVELAAAQALARAYLAETDWYVTRFAETGAAIPDPVSTNRTAARARLNQTETPTSA